MQPDKFRTNDHGASLPSSNSNRGAIVMMSGTAYAFDRRQELLLSQLNRAGLGLEIGPSYSPVVPKASGLAIETVDYLDADALREKYRDGVGIDIGRIESVDHVLGARTIAEAIPHRHHYDYIIASHVIEHMPDLLGFLRDCQTLLKPDGVLALAVPDKRACFDFLLPISTTGQILQAHARGNCHPNAGAVFDHAAYRANLNGDIAWRLGSSGILTMPSDFQEAHELFNAVDRTAEHVDVHIWRFVPSSFRLIVGDLLALGLIRMREKAFLSTSNIEFYCFLSAAAPGGRHDRKALALASLVEQADVARTVQ
jgi:SAM-dependent methyltransferase